MVKRKFALPGSFYRTEAKVFQDQDINTRLTSNFEYLTWYLNTQVQLDVGSNWQDWTPTYVNITEGNGTRVARFTVWNNIVHIYFRLTFGTTTTIDGSGVTISTPVSPSSNYVAAKNTIGTAIYTDDSSNDQWVGHIRLDSSTTFGARFLKVVSSDVLDAALSGSAPFTWATSDQIAFSGTYETV